MAVRTHVPWDSAQARIDHTWEGACLEPSMSRAKHVSSQACLEPSTSTRVVPVRVLQVREVARQAFQRVAGGGGETSNGGGDEAILYIDAGRLATWLGAPVTRRQVQRPPLKSEMTTSTRKAEEMDHQRATARLQKVLQRSTRTMLLRSQIVRAASEADARVYATQRQQRERRLADALAQPSLRWLPPTPFPGISPRYAPVTAPQTASLRPATASLAHARTTACRLPHDISSTFASPLPTAYAHTSLSRRARSARRLAVAPEGEPLTISAHHLHASLGALRTPILASSQAPLVTSRKAQPRRRAGRKLQHSAPQWNADARVSLSMSRGRPPSG